MNTTRRRCSRGATGFGTILFALAAPGHAHETWLLPENFSPPADEGVVFTLTSGMSFPELGSGIDPVRIVDATLLEDGVTQPLVPTRTREGALDLSANPSGAPACAWVRLRPRVLEIESEDSIAHYLEEIGAPDSVWQAWRQAHGSEVWRESYAKLARSYLAGGGGDGAEPCWSTPAGARFDILPLSDPSTLAEGGRLELQLLFDDAPLAGQAVGVVHEGAQDGALARSDEKGRVTLTMPASGRHMIYATHLRRAEGDDYAWESDFLTLTFQVAAR